MNSWWRRETGIRGRGEPEDTSQYMEDALKGMETTEREGLDNIDCTEGHSDCKAGREEKSKLEAERSIETAENNGTAEAEVGTKLNGQERVLLQRFRSQECGL